MKQTPLHDHHVALGAKMVDFAGWHMPVQYTGIVAEHLNVREKGGIFDASHMGQVEIRGDKALEQVQWLTVNDASKLDVFQSQYSAMCNSEGGIIDDVIVSRLPDHFLVVINASNIDKDFQWMIDNRIDGADLVNRSDEFGLVAVQGPQTIATAQPLTDISLETIAPFHLAEGTLAGVPALVSRTGYTGEAQGFELTVRAADVGALWDALMEQSTTTGMLPTGLGARDTLRLEKKFSLYGNDIDDSTTPLEAGLGWITKLDKPGFLGQIALRKQKQDGITRKLVGFVMQGNRLPRHGYAIHCNGEPVGHVTSGGFSPCLSQGIGMGYVAKESAKIGTTLEIQIRNTGCAAEIIKAPFWK
jgi:aminomethyltransferase